MDKNLHKKDIGDWFHDEIEPLNQAPGKHVWENLERQLDKTDASRYKHKFITTRRIATLLFFILVSFATVAILYIIRTENYVVINKVNNDMNKQTSTNNSLKPDKDNNVSNIDINTNIHSLPDKITKTNNSDMTAITLQSITKNIAETRPVHDMKPIKNDNSKSIVIQRIQFLRNPGIQIVKITNATLSQQDVITSEEAQSTYLFRSKDSTFLGSIKNTDPHLQSSLKPIFLNKPDSLIVSTINHSIAKINKKKIIPVSRYSITTFAAPEFAGYILADDEEDLYVNKQVIKNREKHLLSMSGEVLITYKTNKHLSFQSGIIYSASNISIDPSIIYAVNDNVGNIKYRYNTSSGFGYVLPSFSSSPALGDSLYTRTTNHTLEYISIPLIVKYSFEKQKFSFHPGMGIAFNFLTKATLQTEVRNSVNYENESITKLKGLQKVGYSFLLMPEYTY